MAIAQAAVSAYLIKDTVGCAEIRHAIKQRDAIVPLSLRLQLQHQRPLQYMLSIIVASYAYQPPNANQTFGVYT
jgi:hypothetical protein